MWVARGVVGGGGGGRAWEEESRGGWPGAWGRRGAWCGVHVYNYTPQLRGGGGEEEGNVYEQRAGWRRRGRGEGI